MRKILKIMVFGTFDILHPGHINFLEQARKLAANPFLIVSVARDKNVRKIKGCCPKITEKDRLLAVKKLSLADRAVLGSLNDYIGHILKEKPNIIALGYDQKAYVKGLKVALKIRGLTVTIKRLKAYKPKIYKSSLYKRKKLPKY